MSYQQLIERLFNVNRSNHRDLTRARRLHAAMGYPDQQYRTLHIAGSNGKGSVATKIAKALESKFKVGLYTSPHLETFLERIRVNGEMIAEETVECLLQQIFQLNEAHNIAATFFEMTTMLALQYFAERDVDIAVIETGLGGRLDATNVISPELAVITSISLEHTEQLGATREEIAVEKAGIIKPGVRCILGPNAAGLGIEEEHDCILVPPQANFLEENKAIAWAALKELGIETEVGLDALPECRFDEVRQDVLLDVAHNPHGLASLFAAAKERYGRRPIRVVAAFSQGPDIKESLSILEREADTVHLATTAHERMVTLKELAIHSKFHRVASFGPLHKVLPQALEEAKEAGEVLLICGSCFIMGEARGCL